jgi:hypothetical protein
VSSIAAYWLAWPLGLQSQACHLILYACACWVASRVTKTIAPTSLLTFPLLPRLLQLEALRPLTAGILSERRSIAPYGLLGGHPGAPGLNILLKVKSGRSLNIGGCCSSHDCAELWHATPPSANHCHLPSMDLFLEAMFVQAVYWSGLLVKFLPSSWHALSPTSTSLLCACPHRCQVDCQDECW